MLTALVQAKPGRNWQEIASEMEGRTPAQCSCRWTNILSPGLIKGPWTKEEDEVLRNWVSKNGPTKWAQCSELINGRNGKQCRERWFNALNPSNSKQNWSIKEDFTLFYLYNTIGSKWAKIAQFMPGRSDNSLKNRFYSCLRKTAGETVTYFHCKVEVAKLSTTELRSYFSGAFKEKRTNFIKFANFEYLQGETYVHEYEQSLKQEMSLKLTGKSPLLLCEKMAGVASSLKGIDSSRFENSSAAISAMNLSSCVFSDESSREVQNQIEATFSSKTGSVSAKSVSGETAETIDKAYAAKMLKKLESMESWIAETKSKLAKHAFTTENPDQRSENFLDGLFYN